MAIISRITMPAMTQRLLRLPDGSGPCARLVRAPAISGEAGAVPCEFLDSTAAFVDAFDTSDVFSAAERWPIVSYPKQTLLRYLLGIFSEVVLSVLVRRLTLTVTIWPASSGCPAFLTVCCSFICFSNMSRIRALKRPTYPVYRLFLQQVKIFAHAKSTSAPTLLFRPSVEVRALEVDAVLGDRVDVDTGEVVTADEVSSLVVVAI